MNVIHKERETRQIYEWDGDTRLMISILISQNIKVVFRIFSRWNSESYVQFGDEQS